MKKIRISQFNGGQSELEQNTSTYNSDIGNFDIYTDNGKLIPESELATATMAGGNITPYEITDFVKINFGSGYKTYGLGHLSGGSAVATLYGEDTEGNFAQKANAPTAYVKNTLVVYNDLLYFLTTNGSNQYFIGSFTNESTYNNLSTITTTISSNVNTFVNPIDGILYIAIGNVIYTWNGTTLYTGLTLPSNRKITSICAYSSYLAIATKTDSGNSYVYIWDRDRSLSTVTQLVDFGTGSLEVLENIHGALFGISYENGIPNGKMTVRVWQGGNVEVFRAVNSSNVTNLKRLVNNKLYFATRNNNALWCLYKNKAGVYTLTKHYYVANGAMSQLVYGFNFIDGKLYINALNDDTNTATVLYTPTNKFYTNTSYYITTENPSMDNDDLSRYKTLKRVYITFKHSNTPILPILALYASFDGSSWVKMIEETKASGTYTYDTANDINGDTTDNFIQIKFKVELSQRYAEILEIGYIYENTNKNNI